MTPEQRQRAGRAVSARMSERGVTAAWVQREAPVDNKTLQALVEGRRWPNPATRGRIEAVLGWEPGEVERIALDLSVQRSAVDTRPAEHLTNSQLIAELAMRLGEESVSHARARGAGTVTELKPPTRADRESGQAAAGRVRPRPKGDRQS